MNRPEVINRDRFGWAVRWPDGFESAMPDEATALRCAAAPDLLRELMAYRAIMEAIESHCKNDAGLRGLDHADEGRRIRHGLQLLLAEPSAAIAKATSAQRSGS